MTRSSLLCALVLCGCGGPNINDIPPAPTLQPVEGKVLLAGGSPLTSARIHLVASVNGMEAIGEIGKDGTFQIPAAKGLPAGPCQAYISEASFKTGAAVVSPQKAQIPEKYLEQATSPLKAVILDGPTKLEPFTLSK